MTRKEAIRRTHMENALMAVGVPYNAVDLLRRISMQLHRWHELECGVENGGIERDEKTGKCFWYNSYNGKRSPCQDRETGVLRRLTIIMRGTPHLRAYVQSDPRGAALYILRPGDVPEGADESAYYSRGIAVY